MNTSYSLPLGIYIRTDDSRAPLIEFCPVQPFAAESSERGYRKLFLEQVTQADRGCDFDFLSPPEMKHTVPAKK